MEDEILRIPYFLLMAQILQTTL